jgi:iron complex outermembrane receptor protein
MLSLVLAGTGQVSKADEAKYDIRIRQMNAAHALNEYAVQTDVILLFPYDLARAHLANAVHGRYTLLEGLELLLAGTGLSASLSDQRVVKIAQTDNEPLERSEVTMQSKKKTLGTRLATFVAAFFAASTAQPQDQAAGELRIEEVTVTAQKREQRSEDIAMALAVLDGSTLAEQQIHDLADFSRQIPSLDIFEGNGSNNPTITLRGIGTTNPWVNNNPSVAAYADGVYLPFSAFLNFPLFDLQRVEVLKGPQVGLYGRNATAGTINFVSQRPGDQPSGYVDGSFDEYDAVNLEAAIGGPLGDAVQGRIAMLYQNGGGYMYRAGTVDSTAGFTRIPGLIPGIPAIPPEDGYGDRDVLALRGSLQFEPSDEFSALLSLHYAKDDSEIIGSTSITGDPLGVFLPPTDEPFVDYDNADLANDSEQLGGLLELDWLLGENLQLVSVTGFESLERQYNIGDFVPLRVAEASFDEDLQSFYQELRVDYQPSDDFRWLNGISYTSDEVDYHRELTAYDLLLGVLGTRFDQDDTSWAAFTQAEWRVAPAWQLTGSLRYTDESKDYDGGSFEIDPYGVSVVGVVFPNIRPDGLFDQRSYDDDDFSGNASIQWEPTDSAMYYLSIARAFKSGGFDGSGITDPASFTPYGPETVWSYELGGKLRLLDERMFLAGSAFYYDYSDKQVLSLQDLGSGIVEAVIQNAAESEVFGLDLELNWLIAPSLTFTLSGTWLDSEVTSWNSADPAEVLDRVGNELPGTPELSLAAGIDWERQIGKHKFGLRLWANYNDESYRDIENNEALLSDDYAIASARVSLRTANNWTFYLYGKNLFDEEYVTSRRSLVGMLGEYYGPPRTIGLGVRYEMF